MWLSVGPFIFGTLLAFQIDDFYRAILSDFVSSYRRYYNCKTSVLRMTEDWRRMRGRGELVAVVFMDLSKAFDVIQQPLPLTKLKPYGVDIESRALLQDYLSHRSQRVKFGDAFSNWESV